MSGRSGPNKTTTAGSIILLIPVRGRRSVMATRSGGLGRPGISWPWAAILVPALVGILALLPAVLLPVQATVARPTLDPTFGSGGISRSPIQTPREDVAGAAAVQADGKVVIAGGSQGGLVPMLLAVVRLNRDGSPDRTFGVDGRVLLDRAFPTYTSGPYSMVAAVAIDGSGRILLGGAQVALSGSRPLIVRLLPNGQPDGSFGSGGAVILPFEPPPFMAVARSITPLADGRLVVGGDGRVLPEAAFATRLNLNGSIDLSFGTNGFVSAHPASTVFVDSAGRIVAATRDEARRWTADGRPDPTFGQGGYVAIADVGASNKTAVSRPGGGILLLGGDDAQLMTTALAANGSLDRSYGGGTGTRLASFDDAPNSRRALLGLPTGGFVIASGWFGGTVAAPAGGIAIGGFRADGTPDPAFGRGQTVHTDLQRRNVGTAAVARGADGTLYAVAGNALQPTSDDNGPPLRDFVVTAYRANGDLVTGFGQGGTATVDFKAPGWIQPGRAAVDPFGRVVSILNGYGTMVARLTTAGHLDPTFGQGGVAYLKAGSLETIATDTRGNIVVGGWATDSSRSVVIRLTPAGQLDPAFSDDGILTEPGPAEMNYVSALATLPDGGIVTATTANPGAGRCLPAATITRYRADGQLDPSFGNGGRTSVEPAPQACRARVTGLTLDAQGRPAVSVASNLTGNTVTMKDVLRLTSAGAPDVGFGTGGSVRIDLGGDGALAVDPPSGTLVAGGTDGGTLAAVRISPTGTAGPILSHPSPLTSGPAGYAVVREVTVDEVGGVQLFGGIAPARLGDGWTWAAEAFRPDGSDDTRRGPDGILGGRSTLPLTGAAQSPDGHLVLTGFNSRHLEARRYGVPTAPTAPAITRTVAGRGFVTVGWSAPADDGGGRILAYVVVAQQPGRPAAVQVVPGDVRSVSLPALANGQPATVTVVAWNGRGPGATSPPSAATPSAGGAAARPPDPPQALTAAAGTTYATLRWSPPADDGGGPVTGYRASAVDRATGAVVAAQTVAADVRNVSVGGLSPGRQYDLHVSASNITGSGRTSPVPAVPTSSGLPSVTPGPVGAIGHSRSGGTTLTVSWPPALDDGGAPVTGYAVLIGRGNTVQAARGVPAAARQTTFQNVPPGTVIYVLAQNAHGYGAHSLGFA